MFDVIVESNYLKPSTYQDKSGIEPLHYSKVSSPDNHICNDESCKGNLPENPQATIQKTAFRYNHFDEVNLEERTFTVV